MIRVSSGVFSRGILLVAIPIVLQIIFVVWLAAVLADVQKKLQEQWKSEELIRIACQFSRHSTDAIVYMQMPPDVQELVGKDVSTLGLERPKKDFELLKALAAPKPKLKPYIEDVERYGKTLFNLQQREMERAEQLKRRLKLIDELPTEFERREARKAARREALLREGKEVPDRLKAIPTPPANQHKDLDVSFRAFRKIAPPAVPEINYKVLLNEFGPRFYDAIDGLVHAEEGEMADTNSFGAGSIVVINRTLLFMILLSVTVTIILGYLYSVSIRRPIKQLCENGRRLSAQQPLLPVLSTVDEFAKLDQLLHQNSAELELALARERAVMDNAADLICIIDEQGNFLVINPFVERMLGYMPEELLNKPVNLLTVAEQSLLADEYIRNAISRAEQHFELRLKKRNGEFVETRWSCIWSDEDKKLFCVVHDVSEEKAIEQLKQDFADMISHDLRSPLMAMGNSLTLIEAGVKGEISPEARLSVQASAKNVEKLISLVNDLLDFQKLKAGKMQLDLKPIGLEAIIKDAADLVAETARAKGIELELPEGETMVMGDRNKLMQTAVNLISNAIKFSGTASRVSVRVEENEKTASFSVSDSGPGVPVEFQERIFEPFEQAPSRQKSEGTGLGLAICKLVVQAHGGSIRCANRSDSGQSGSIFTVELPL